MVTVQDITITEIDTISAFAVTTGDYLFTLDELQNCTVSQSQETTDITGKAGRKLNTLKRNKSISISATNGLVSGGLLELQTGGTFSNKTTKVMWTDYLTVDSNSATTSYKAVGTSGAEIKKLYTKNADGTIGSELSQASTAASGKFTYTPNTKALTFSGVSDNTDIVVVYERNIQADVLTCESDKYSGKATLYIDALGEDKCANLYRVQFYIPKADISGEFSLDMGDSQTVHGFDAEALAGACGAGGAFFTYTVFGANTADAS